MEYLTIEEKSSLDDYLVLLDEKIKTWKSLGLSSKYWENKQKAAKIAIEKIYKNPSLEIIEIRKTYQNNSSCKH